MGQLNQKIRIYIQQIDRQEQNKCIDQEIISLQKWVENKKREIKTTLKNKVYVNFYISPDWVKKQLTILRVLLDNFIQTMNSSIIELDNMDQYHIYQQNISKLPQNQNISLISKKQINLLQASQVNNNPNQQKKDSLNIPSKFIIRPGLLKYIDNILQLYLDQKTPYQIQTILREPSLNEIQYILKEKIHTFLNIIFESSHRYTEDQVQKIRSEISQKIERISIEMLDPLSRNFIDPLRYKNFLKLMKYHKEGRRSQKISKNCYTFFRLFFITMKFSGISHTQGNVIQLNQSKNSNAESFHEQNDQSAGSDYDMDAKRGSGSSKNQGKSSYKYSSSKKKYNYAKQQVVSQSIMDEAREELIREIRNNLSKNNQKPEVGSIKQTDKNSNANSKEKMTVDKPQVISLCKEVDFQKQKPIQWNFDKENTLLFLLFEGLQQKLKFIKSIKMIQSRFLSKYMNIQRQSLSFERICLKIQSMYSISSQKFLRRVKFLTIQEGIQMSKDAQRANQQGKQGSSYKSSRKKRIYSIIQIQKSIQEENDKNKLSKEDQFYFSKLKEKLKSIDVRQVYFSSYEGALCAEEWKFMLQFLRDCYFTSLEDLAFQYLLNFAKRAILLNPENKNFAQISIPIQDEDQTDQKDSNELITAKNKDQQKDDQNDLIDKLPKSSFSLTLSRITKPKSSPNEKLTNSLSTSEVQQQSKENNNNEVQQYITLDQILKKSSHNNQTISQNKTISAAQAQVNKKTSEDLQKSQVKEQCLKDQVRNSRVNKKTQKKPLKQTEKLIKINPIPYNQSQNKLTQDSSKISQVKKQNLQDSLQIGSKAFRHPHNRNIAKYSEIRKLNQLEDSPKELQSSDDPEQLIIKNNSTSNEKHTDQIVKNIGHPNKKIKSNVLIQDQNLTIESENYLKNVEDNSHNRKQKQTQNEEQFEQIFQLSEPIIMQIIEEKETLKRPMIPSVMLQRKHQKMRENALIKIKRQPVQNIYTSTERSDWHLQKEQIWVVDDQSQQIYEEGQMKKQEIELILDQIQEEAKISNENKLSQSSHQKQPMDLSIIEEQEEEGLSHYHSFQKQDLDINNPLPLQDQYSIYEIDLPIQTQTFQNQMISIKKNFYTDQDRKLNKFQAGKSKQDDSKEKIINKTNSIEQMQNLDIIKRELQRIKSMEKYKTISQNMPLSMKNSKVVEEKLGKPLWAKINLGKNKSEFKQSSSSLN